VPLVLAWRWVKGARKSVAKLTDERAAEKMRDVVIFFMTGIFLTQQNRVSRLKCKKYALANLL
jgi:hypothetical protein